MRKTSSTNRSEIYENNNTYIYEHHFNIQVGRQIHEKLAKGHCYFSIGCFYFHIVKGV